MECDDNITSEDPHAIRQTSPSKDEEISLKSSNDLSGSPRPISVTLNSHDSNIIAPAAASGINKVLGHNYNGTVVFTSSPKNEAELQLYRVMQKASLLSYYDTLLEMGGDDVQQLCDAGEEEFLEIMALVGMASKPLHVRRFQKALQEWLSNPLMFQTSITAPSSSISSSSASMPALSSLCLLPRPLSVHNVSSSPMSCPIPLATTIATPIPSPNSTPVQQLGEISSCTSINLSPAHGSTSSISPGPRPGSPLQTHNSQPILDESQIKKLQEAALRLVQNLPELEPKYHSTKKKVGKELQAVLNMSDDDPFRMQHIRKFSAIYGRFDCKRRPEKPLTLHEVSVNEAAAQICKYIPALLTRRDELFPLARQVVRDSGYHYSKGHSKSYAVSNLTRTTSLANTYKFNDNFSKRKSNENSNIFDSNKNEEKLSLLKLELQKLTTKLDQLNSAMQNISEETSEFSALKYQIEAFNRQKLQLLEEYECLSNIPDIPRKRIRKLNNQQSSEADEIDSQYSYNDDGDLVDSEQHDNEEDTKGSNIVYIHQDTSCYSGEESDDVDKADNIHHRHLKSDVRNEKNHEFISDNYKEKFYADDKFQVIAAKGDDIIAVTNPALRMSSASVTSPSSGNLILKKERISPIEFIEN